MTITSPVDHFEATISGSVCPAIDTDKLIDEIQGSLYSDNSELPRVLTLCLDLCNVMHLSDEYGEWLRRELNGFSNIKEFQQKFPNHEQYEEWMDKWMTYRQVDAYVKVTYRPPETGRQEIKNVPLTKFFVVWSILFMIDTLTEAKASGKSEMSFLLRDVAPEVFEKIKLGPKQNIDAPYDLRAFMNFAEFNRILNDVREKVLSLLSEARKILAE